MKEILRCVEKALAKYGNTVSNAIFWHFNIKTKIERKDMPSEPELFEEDLNDLFGLTAGSIVGEIIKEIRRSFRRTQDEINFLI